MQSISNQFNSGSYYEITINYFHVLQDHGVGVLSEERADFEFSDIFEFVQSGIEAIVNDQVTQRFVAEELKVSYFYTLIAFIYLHE